MATMHRTVAVDDRNDNGLNRAEVGVDEGDNIIDLVAEDRAAVVLLRLTADEAQDLINTLYEAIRVVEMNG